MRGVRAAGRRDAAGRLSRRAAGTGQRARRREGRCAHVPWRPASVRWARGHMVFSKPCARVRRHRPAAACSAARSCGGARARGADRGACRCSVPPGVADGARLRVAGEGARRPARRPHRRSLRRRCTSQPHPLFRREGDDLHHRRAGRRCTKRCSARASTCRRSTGRAAARAAGHAGGAAVPAARARRADRATAGAATSSSRSRLVLPPMRRRAIEGADAGVRPAATATTSGRDLSTQ